jgi:ribosome-binding protein aMBF1 (putative translation factor)
VKQRRKISGKKTTKSIDSPGMRYLYDRYIGKDPVQQAHFEEHQANAEIARQVYDLRTKAGLSQRALAKQVGTTASVICRLEDADYDGHSLSMLRRIAAALNKRVEIRFLPAKRKLQTSRC